MMGYPQMMLPFVSLATALLVGRGLPTTAPREVAMSAVRLETVDRVVRRGVTAGAYPGAAVVIGRRGYAVWQKAYGRVDWSRTGRPVDVDATIYDLASLTKVVATTTAAMILVDEGTLDLDAPIQRYLPEFTGPGKERVTVAHLLAHRSGLPAGIPVRRADDAEAVRQRILLAPLRATPGSTMLYSDLGPILVGWAIEVITGEPLDRFVTERVFEPLGMADTRFHPDGAVRARIAPTELPVRGIVHDETARTLGGVAGNAGLFSTATDLAIFAEMLLNGGTYGDVRIVSDSTVRRFTTPVGDARALGWEVAAGERGAGEFLSQRAFGHVGFTGTSLWIDPARDLFVILLTNRVHAPRTRRAGVIIADVRHDVADAAALAVTDEPRLADVAWPRTFRTEMRLDWNPRRRVLDKRPTTRARGAE